MKIYVASSWRNPYQQEIVALIRGCGHEVYDFRNPHATGPDRGRRGIGFAWREIDPAWQSWSPDQFREALKHPVARDGFDSDADALAWCDLCVLVLPCGRSSHLEAGWAKGAGKKLVIIQFENCEPELMYSWADAIVTSACEAGSLFLHAHKLFGAPRRTAVAKEQARQ